MENISGDCCLTLYIRNTIMTALLVYVYFFQLIIFQNYAKVTTERDECDNPLRWIEKEWKVWNKLQRCGLIIIHATSSDVAEYLMQQLEASKFTQPDRNILWIVCCLSRCNHSLSSLTQTNFVFVSRHRQLFIAVYVCLMSDVIMWGYLVKMLQKRKLMFYILKSRNTISEYRIWTFYPFLMKSWKYLGDSLSLLYASTLNWWTFSLSLGKQLHRKFIVKYSC